MLVLRVVQSLRQATTRLTVSSTQRFSSTMAAKLSPIPAVEKLSDCVTRVLGCNPGPFTLQGTNCYLVGTGKSKILVDTGEESNGEFLSNLRQTLDTNGWGIQEILITHWHRDHAGGIEGICKMQPNGGSMRVSKFPQVKSTDKPLQDGLLYTYVENGQTFTTEGATLRAMYTPGHADDHMCLWLDEDQAMFTGDTVLGEGTCVFEDLSDYMKSLELIRAQGAKLVYPAHGPLVTDPHSHLTMYITHRQQRESQIMAALSASAAPLSIPDIVKAVYPELPPNVMKGAEWNVQHHLSKLIKESCVLATEDGTLYKVAAANL